MAGRVFCVRPRKGGTDGPEIKPRLINGTRAQVEQLLLSELSIEPASVEDAVRLGADGVIVEHIPPRE